MTAARALGTVAIVVVAAQVAAMWGGMLAVMAIGLIVAAAGEESGR